MIKSSRHPADAPGMTHLPAETWVFTALIAGVCVMSCLGVLAALMRHERSIHALHRDVERLRRHYAGLYAGIAPMTAQKKQRETRQAA